MANRLEEVFLRFQNVLDEIGSRHPEEQEYIVNSYESIRKTFFIEEMEAEKEVSVV